MHSMIRTAVATATLALCIPFASATVLTFDDILGPDEYGATVPGNYGGLDWSAAGWAVFAGEFFPFTAHSGDARVTTGFESDDGASIIRFLTPTVFEGAWFAGYTDSKVQFKLYLNDVQVGLSSILTLSDTPAFLAAGWGSAIDAVVVSSPVQASYVMDDFTFADAAVVPEPATLALVLFGLGIGVASNATRRRRS